MSQLITEILLRLAKLAASGLVATVLYLIAVIVFAVSPSFEVAALCWISASVALLLIESSPL
jgi:hypothetical protein